MGRHNFSLRPLRCRDIGLSQVEICNRLCSRLLMAIRLREAGLGRVGNSQLCATGSVHSSRDWDIARFKVSERRPVIGELRSSGGAVACRLVDFTLRIGRENSRIGSGSPTIREPSRAATSERDVLLGRLVRLARHPLAGRNNAISVRLVRRMAL